MKGVATDGVGDKFAQHGEETAICTAILVQGITAILNLCRVEIYRREMG